MQVGLVAASLAELRVESAEALDIRHPWFVRLLLVEPDGRGSTEVLDERFFATVSPLVHLQQTHTNRLLAKSQ